MVPSGNNCTVNNLSPSTQYEMVETAMIGMKKTDGSIVFVLKEVRTPFITLETPNTAPVANPDFTTVISGQSVTFYPLDNDRDSDGNTLKIGTFSQ